MPIVGSPGVQVIDEIVDDRRIAQPAAFEYMKGCGIIEIGERLPCPGHIVEKFQNRCALRTDLADVGPEDLPSIVVDLLDFLIIDLEERDIS